MSKVKEFMSYTVYRSFPFVEYIADAILNWKLTQQFINHRCKADKLKERLRLFITVTIRSFLYILITGFLFTKFVEPIATALFNDFNFPIFAYPFCIFIAWKCFNNVLDDFS